MKKNILIIILLICIVALGVKYNTKVAEANYLQSSIDQQFQYQIGSLISSLININYDTINIENEYYRQAIYSITYVSNMKALTSYNQKNKKLGDIINYLYDHKDTEMLAQSELLNPDNLELRKSLGQFHMNLNSEEESIRLLNLLNKD